MSEQQPRTILVVDDNPATRYSTGRLLRAAGFAVIEAATGEEAVARSLEGPDLVVLDVNLPDIDGFEVCGRIRANPLTARTPVLHLSATFVKDVDKVHGLEAGADGYLTHPVEPPVLIATVNAFLRARVAEAAMKRSEAKFRAVFDHALHGMSLVTRDLVFLDVNGAMCQLLGHRREEVVGKHVSAFLPHDWEGDLADVAATLDAGGAWSGTFSVVRSDGRRADLEWTISFHTLPGVRLAIATDVTARRVAEAERERLHESERAARAGAEQANRLKDDFLATLSHELRTPLNAIVGWSQLLKRGRASPEDIVDGIDAIERNAQSQARLIDDLLDVSRITSGKLRLELTDVDLAAVVNAALDVVMPAAEAKGIEVERAIRRDVGTLWADPSRLQQVVWNLVTNAVKFTPKGGRVRVAVARADSHVEVVVSDSGLGIGAEFLPHIFERFRQEDASSKRSHGGLGLGLAIVKSLVEMHGGAVTAASDGEGKGATFVARMPIAAVPEAAPETEPDAESPAPGQGPAREVPAVSLRGVRVLVVDDEPDARRLLRRLLSESGAEVKEAAAVPGALDCLGSFDPHLLVSDIGMPHEDGYDLIREVRARGWTADKLPAIALTAFARPEDRHHALAAGFQHHFGKPVDPAELLDAVTVLLGERIKPMPPQAERTPF